jgi:D-glycero-alpha-D-manno-heptose-7-phosphate kinase|tara:strand:+ start:2046 stop:3035 length:990 start_codon:yes stop_codon:yes gene_type:complete
MIVSKTPLRISFMGGMSDLPSYYEKEAGAVVTTAIDKYIYITINKKFDDKIRASYSITEFVDNPNELKHELIRESLNTVGIHKGIEITSISDIPSKGTGLGSSSTYTVGLLNALYAYLGKSSSAEKLARHACDIEINKCKRDIGKQDQYIAAYGGLNYIRFNSDGSTFVNPIICPKETKKELQENLLFFYTGLSRTESAHEILTETSSFLKSNKKKRLLVKQLVTLADEMKLSLEESNLEYFGYLLNEGWVIKRKTQNSISNEYIDEWYRIAISNGALGGKLSGAGGGGFLIFYAPKEKHNQIINSLPKLTHIPINLEPQGTQIIYVGG